jgi:hypothetical protein
VFEAIKTSTVAGQRSDKGTERIAESVSPDSHEARANAIHEATVQQSLLDKDAWYPRIGHLQVKLAWMTIAVTTRLTLGPHATHQLVHRTKAY